MRSLVWKSMAAVFAVSMVFATSSVKAQEIELWSFIQPGPENARTQALEHVIETFEAEHPEITVKTNVIQWQQIGQTLMRASAAGRAPDVVMLYSPFIQEHIAAGTISSLDSYFEALSEDEQSDIITLSEARDADGALYGLPYELRAIGLLYRRDLLDEKGIDPPGSIDELFALANDFGTEGLLGFGAGFNPSSPSPTMEWFITTLYGMGSPILKADGGADFDNAPTKELLSKLRNLVQESEGLPIDVVLRVGEEIQQFSEAGRVAFTVLGTHRMTAVQSNSGLGTAYAWMPPPGNEPNSVSPAMLQGWVLVIPKGAPHPEASWEFIKHWTSPEMQLHQSVRAGYLPMRASLSEDPAFQTPENQHITAALNYAAENPLDFKWTEDTNLLYTTLAQIIENVVTDTMTVDDAVVWGESSFNSQRK